MIYFNLGKNPALSLAEIVNVYKGKNILHTKDIVFIDDNINIESAIDKFGGVIKGGKIIGKIKLEGDIKEEIKKWLENYIIGLIKGKKIAEEKKFNFGISACEDIGRHKAKDVIKFLAMDLKRKLKENNITARWINSKENNLSSVIVQNNNLFIRKNGIEIMLFCSNEDIFIGETISVQKFSRYSQLDYGRPERDARSGMLPIKLAKIMINLTGGKNEEVLLDPFCGSGTVLQESLLLGYKNIIGSDFKKEVIENCEANLKWLTKKIPDLNSNRNLKLLSISSEKLSASIAENSINTIVTEPYLGPPVRKGANQNQQETAKTLSKLYIKSFKQFAKILIGGGVVVMVLPIFKSEEKGSAYYKFMQIFSEIEKLGFEKINLLPQDLIAQCKEMYGKKVISKRNTLIYSRPGQFVLREIVKFRKT